MLRDILLKGKAEKKVTDEIGRYQNMTPIQKKNLAVNRNLKGDKLAKIIEEVAVIKNKTELLKAQGADIKKLTKD
jgi:hypothetical protein